MNKKTWDLYAPIYKCAMKADQQIYDFMYVRIPEIIRGKSLFVKAYNALLGNMDAVI